MRFIVTKLPKITPSPDAANNKPLWRRKGRVSVGSFDTFSKSCSGILSDLPSSASLNFLRVLSTSLATTSSDVVVSTFLVVVLTARTVVVSGRFVINIGTGFSVSLVVGVSVVITGAGFSVGGRIGCPSSSVDSSKRTTFEGILDSDSSRFSRLYPLYELPCKESRPGTGLISTSESRIVSRLNKMRVE